MDTQFKFAKPDESRWIRRDGSKVDSFEQAILSEKATALIFYVEPDHWAPIWLQKLFLGFKRYILRRSLET